MPPTRNPCSELSKTVTDLAMAIGERPDVKNLDDVLREIQKQIPELGRAELVASVNEATSGYARAKNELAQKLADLKREARNDKAVREATRDLQNRLASNQGPPPPKPKRAPPEAIRRLREERDGLRLRINQEAGARERIAVLEKHIREGTLPETRPAAPVDPAVAELRAQADALQKALRNSEPALRKKYEKQIADLTERLELGVDAPVGRDAPALSKDLEKLVYNRDRLRRQVRQRIADLRPKSWFQRTTAPVTNTLNAARAVMTSMDFSAVLRQGFFAVTHNPAKAAKALGPMFRAFASKEASHAINSALLDADKNPNAPLYDRAGLYVASDDTTSGSLSKQEEAFMSRLVGKIPLVAGSQRAYVTFLNTMRAQVFDSMTATLARNEEATLEEARAIANYINVATGRGGLGKMENAATALNTIFFAPRYVTSRFQLLAGQPLYGGTGRTRKLIAREYAKALTGFGLVFALGALAGGELEDDPTSSDFGKIRFGNTRIDPLAGLAQATTFLARSGEGVFNTVTGKEDKTFRRGTIAGRFIRSKLAPVPSSAVNLVEGENIVGEKSTVGREAVRMVTPLSFGEIADIMEEQGIPRGTAIGILNLFGMGAQHYESKGR